MADVWRLVEEQQRDLFQRLDRQLAIFRTNKIGEGPKIIEVRPGEYGMGPDNRRMPNREEAVASMRRQANASPVVKELVDNLRYSIDTYGLSVDDTPYYLAREYLLYRYW